ncbi:MAG: metallothionein [Nostoc sp.]
MQKVMTTVTQMKCACSTCLCIVSVEDAIKKDNKYYCSQGCAEGHKTIKGCSHTGYGC